MQSHQELYDVIQNKSEDEGFEIVCLIRRGHDVDAILDHIRDGNLLLQAHDGLNHHQQQQHPAAAAAEHRWRPSMQDMLSEDGGTTATTPSPNPSLPPPLTRLATDVMSILAVCQAD